MKLLRSNATFITIFATKDNRFKFYDLQKRELIILVKKIFNFKTIEIKLMRSNESI